MAVFVGYIHEVILNTVIMLVYVFTTVFLGVAMCLIKNNGEEKFTTFSCNIFKFTIGFYLKSLVITCFKCK